MAEGLVQKCCKFYAKEKDEQKAAHTMKNPDKHSMNSFFGENIRLKSKRIVKEAVPAQTS